MTREEYENAREDYKKELQEKYDSTGFKGEALKQFKLERFEISTLFSRGFYMSNHEEGEMIQLAKNIAEIIKEQELTYDQAYATLEMVYNQLKYESNFTKIK